MAKRRPQWPPPHLPPPRYRVGDWMRFDDAGRQVGRIVEYRGPFGGGGEHVYRLRFVSDYGKDYQAEGPSEVERRESLLEPLPPVERPDAGYVAAVAAG